MEGREGRSSASAKTMSGTDDKVESDDSDDDEETEPRICPSVAWRAWDDWMWRDGSGRKI